MGTDRPPGARRPVARLRAWLSLSLANRITVTALGLALAVALAIGATSYLAVRAALVQRIEADLGAQARLVGRELEAQLNVAVRDLASLAASSLVANGLVDSQGRDAYLAPLLREHAVPNAPGTEIVLCDFRGRPIASNLPALPEAMADAPPGDRPLARVASTPSGAWLVLSWPIVFPPTGQREGTLVARVDLELVFSGALRRGAVVADATLAAGEATLARPGRGGGGAVVAERLLELEPPLDAVPMRVALAEGDAVLAPVRTLGLATAVVGAVGILVVAAAARRVAQGLTGRLAALSEAAREIAAGTRTMLPRGATPGDEVDTVASAFNGTLEQLRAVRQTLEQKVAERTADLVQRERELGRSREQLALAVEGSRLAVWRWDLELGEVATGEAGPALLGYGPGELGGRFAEWAALIHPDDRDRVRAEIVAHLKGAVPQLDTRFRMRARDGSWRWFHTRGRVAERDARGRARSVAGTHADVTALEDLHRRLFAATRLASVGTLAAGVAHEINNPLTFLGANLTVAAEQLADAGPLEPRRAELRTLLEEARDGAARIAAIVRSMRALGAPERDLAGDSGARSRDEDAAAPHESGRRQAV